MSAIQRLVVSSLPNGIAQSGETITKFSEQAQ